MNQTYQNLTLVADAGSTSVDWVLIAQDLDNTLRFKTAGLNAMQASEQQIADNLESLAEQLPHDMSIGNVYYYGAGCATPQVCRTMEASISKALGARDVLVASDLLGAARSLLGHSPGVACILGTGSNSCLYDGNGIVSNVPPLGYVIGDEGSGAALGIRLLSDRFKGLMPEEARLAFDRKYNLSSSEVLCNVYRGETPSRFLASFVPFIAENPDISYLRNLVADEFSNFMRRNVLQYPAVKDLPVNFTGSIAWYFKDILLQAAEPLGIKIGTITKSPLDGLIAYHK